MFHVKHRTPCQSAVTTSLAYAFTQRAGSHGSGSTGTISENEELKRVAHSHVPRETSLDLILTAVSTLCRGDLGAKSYVGNREYASSFQTDGSDEHDFRNADTLRHTVTPKFPHAPYVAVRGGALGVAAGCSA